MAIYRGPGGPGDATTDAANEASVASNKATEAAASAAAALASEVAAAASASAASASASAASSSASSASSSASSASSSASSASTSASNASTSATSAASSATDAETAQAAAEAAQAAAEAAQAAAETAETNAETAETNAETAQAAAEAARDAALAALDNFDDRYLGQKSSDPTLDNDGNALVTGALYFNTTSGVMKVYDGSSWLAAYVAGDQALNDLTDVTITSASNGQVLKYNGTAWVNAAEATETDPVFSASEAASITSTDTTNWDTAYGWGNHASAGYLTSYTETDPVFSAAPAAGITSTQVTNWDTAYGWGNHATAGYLTSETYTGTVTSVDMTVPTGLSVSGNPVTSSGTLAVTYSAGYAIPTTTKQSNWDDSYTFTSNFPSQTGNAGEYLTTDGSTLSWAPINVTPALDDLSDVTITTAANGEVLQYNGTAWVNAVVATGNTTSTGLWENSNTISSNYTIGTNYNAMSAGPVTVASGVTVTVPSGSRWVVI
jgi:hypothetical protein